MDSSYSIPTIRKAFSVIKSISKNNNGSTLTDIVNEIEAPKSSVFKILYSLMNENIIEKKDDRYYLGNMLIHYGLHTLAQRDIKTVSNPYLYSLMEATGETAHAAIPVGMKSMLLDVVLTTHPISFSSPVGSLFPMYCTSHGKTFLAYTDNFTIDEYLENNDLIKRTDKTIVSAYDLKNEIKIIREQGYSMDEIEFEEDIRCCAAPIMDNSGKCIAAIGVTSTTITFTKERVPEISEAVKDAAHRISNEMGYRQP